MWRKLLVHFIYLAKAPIMRAAIVESFGNVVIKEVPTPTPGADEALVRITAAGVCHTDVHLAHGDWPGLKPPYPLGHEAIGVVEALGPGAEAFVKVGDRVIMGLGGAAGAYWCGACEYCLAGKTFLCPQRKNFWTGFAEHTTIWAKALVKLPDEVGDREVSLACAGVTSYSAVKKLSKYGVAPGKTVAIVGAAGGVGHYAVQIAKAFGYRVIGVDMGADRLAFVKSLGADDAVEVGDAIDFVKNKYGRVHASIIFSPKIAGFELGLKMLRPGGVFIMVGLPAVSDGHLKVVPIEILSKDILLLSSCVGTVEEMRELVPLAAAGKVKSHIGRTACLSKLNDVLDDLTHGRYTGRAIIDDLTT